VANTINGINGSSAASIGAGRAAKPIRDAAGATAADAQTDTSGDVHITSTASQLASLGQALRAMPAVDQARVSQISRAIDDGSYTVSPDKIASGLVQSDRALAQLGMQEV
jgi:negative regulator of flagellin synthesis FlgM